MPSVSDADDILQVAKNYIMKLTEPEEPEKPEQEFENSVVNLIRTNIRENTHKNLQNEVVSKIMLIIFEYKKTMTIILKAMVSQIYIYARHYFIAN